MLFRCWKLLLLAAMVFSGVAAVRMQSGGLQRLRRAPSAPQTNSLNVTIVEEQPVGTRVFNLIQNVSDLPRPAQYSFFPSTDYLEISQNGIVTVKSLIDRDSQCNYGNPHIRGCCKVSDGSKASACTLQLSIMIQTPVEAHFIPFSVTIKDVNDNAPRFTFPSSTVNINENSKGGHVPLPIATDRDVDANDVQEYRLVAANYSNIFELLCTSDDNSNFSKNATTCRRLAKSSPLRPHLYIKTPTDRETQDRYELLLVAVDGGVQPQSATVSINVIVNDVNDHAPRFSQNSFVFNVSEGEAVGHEIGKVMATDNDLDKNAEIDYRISSSSGAEDFFAIDHGTLRLNYLLDFDRLQQQYRFLVVAQDGGQLSASASVTVNVLDANDNSPRITVNLVNQDTPDRLVLVENETNLQRLLGMVQVDDADSDRDGNNNVTCTIDSPYFHLRQQLVANQPGSKSYNIHSKQTLDRELLETFELYIKCEDSGYPALSTQSVVTVEVLDLNDNAPTMLGPSVFDILENSLPETSIGFVNAADSDKPGTANSTILYRITDDVGSQFFTINERTGELFSTKPFDRETRAEYRFNVTLSDQGSSPLNSTCEIVVNVRDVNDNPPQIRASTTVFNVREDLAPNSQVGRLEADDIDERDSDNSRVNFRLLTGDEYFILTNTGDLFTRVLLDREHTPTHVFLVNLTNIAQAYPSPSSTATIRVNVLDAKDTAPRFMTRTQPIANVSCYESKAVEVATLAATDEDLNETLTYTISSGNDQNHFTIDENTGTIRLQPTNWACSNTMSVYKLQVKATDTTGRVAQTILDVLVTQETNPNKSSAIEQNSLLNNEAVKIVIVLICASLVLATAMIVVVLVFKVRPKRNARYMVAAPTDDGVYPKPGQHMDEEVENHSDARSSSEERYAAVIDNNNNGDGNDSDDNNDTLVHNINEERERIAKAAALNEKLPLDYDSASRCSSQLAAVDNRSTLTRAADRELLYYTHGKQQLARTSQTPCHLNSISQHPVVATDCECVACQSAYASVAEYPYAASLSRPIPPLPTSNDDSPSTTCTAPRRSSTRTLPRRLTSSGSTSHTFKQDARCAEQHPHPVRSKDGAHSVYGDMVYCSTCDALAHSHCRNESVLHQPPMPQVCDAVIQLNSNSDRVYGTHLRRSTINTVKSFVAKSNATTSATSEQGRSARDSTFKRATMERSLTYFSPDKLTAKTADPTYGDHTKSSPYYSVSYV